MEKNEKQQFFDILGKAQRILVAIPSRPDGDTLGASLGLAAFLKKMNKEAEMVCETNDFGRFSFLPGIENIKHELGFAKNFVVSVDTEKTPLDEISYHKTGNVLKIYLKPKPGSEYQAEQVTFSAEAPSFDLIITLDVSSLEHLGDLYYKNAQMFFDTPKVNIDNHVKNENFGQINIVDVTSASSSEILLQLLKEYEEALIDENIATDLLAGIISETNSFQHPHTTPNSFLNASQLISYGARQQEIIQYLFKTKELPVLKLLGRAMARMSNMKEYGSVLSVVTKSDIEKSAAGSGDIYKVFQELISSVSDARILFFVAENNEGLELYIFVNQNIKLEEIVNHFGGKTLSVSVGRAYLKGKTSAEAETIIHGALMELKPRLGI